MKRTKLKRSTIVPAALLAYLAFMAYYGRGYLLSGEYLYYFVIIAVSLVVIALLRFTMRRQEKMRERDQTDQSTQYGSYQQEDEKKPD